MAEIVSQTFPASKLGEYTVIDEIAEGTFGKVKSELHELCMVALAYSDT